MRYRDDDSLVELFFLQFEQPSLIPILREALQRGGTFFDVGANIGVYAGWGARLVGATGSVHAFEPVGETRAFLVSFAAQNGLGNLRIVPLAVGSESGNLVLHLRPGASGRASAFRPSPERSGTAITVPMTSLDGYVGHTGCPPPDLIKIDVEGYEFEVIRGARGLLSTGRPPLVVFESQADDLRRSGVSFHNVAQWFDREVGYRLYALTRRGLQPLPSSVNMPYSTNTLAARPRVHDEVLHRLAGVRFRRNQTL